MKEPVKLPADEGYTLANPPPRLPEWRGPQPENTRQAMLFAGLDCLPGQRSLFETDGESEQGQIDDTASPSCEDSL
jgi:hypothetical protein